MKGWKSPRQIKMRKREKDRRERGRSKRRAKRRGSER